MDVEARNKFCGLLMFTPSTGSNITVNNYDTSTFTSFSESEPYYSESIAAGAAATDENENGNGKKSPGSSKSQLEKRPPRPPNAFILYRREKQPGILAEHRHLTNAQISRYIADLWRSESNETRLHWEREADKTKLEHMKAYPNYVYRPNKKGKKERPNRRERRKSSNSGLSTSSVETGPIKVKINKGQNRMNILSGPDMTKFSNNYQNMLSTPSSGSPTWIPDMIYNSGTNEELLTPVTPPLVNAQPNFQDFTMWTMVPSQLAPNNHNLPHLTYQTINELPTPTFHEEIIDPSMILFNDNSFYDQTAFINTKSSNNNNPNTGVGHHNQYDNYPIIDEILANMELASYERCLKNEQLH